MSIMYNESLIIAHNFVLCSKTLELKPQKWKPKFNYSAVYFPTLYNTKTKIKCSRWKLK